MTLVSFMHLIIVTVCNEVAKVMFLTCLSFCPQGGSTWAGPPRQVPPAGAGAPPRQVHPSGRYIHQDQVPPPGPGTPPGTRYPLWRGLLLRTVHILLECILFYCSVVSPGKELTTDIEVNNTFIKSRGKVTKLCYPKPKAGDGFPAFTTKG